MKLKPTRTLTLEELESIEKSQASFIPANVPKKTEAFKKVSSGRYHLPVLYINDPTQWPVANKEDMKLFTAEQAGKTCLENCCGVVGLKAGCCHLDPINMEHVLGPVQEDWIKDLQKWLTHQKIYMKRGDIVIDWEEGKLIGETFFNNHEVFQSQASYPILRFQVTGPRFACKFLSTDTGRCTIYAKRPTMCMDFYCQFLLANFLVKTREHPNKYVKMR